MMSKKYKVVRKYSSRECCSFFTAFELDKTNTYSDQFSIKIIKNYKKCCESSEGSLNI